MSGIEARLCISPSSYCFRGRSCLLPLPLYTTRTAYFYFSEWFAGVRLSCELFDLLYTVFEDIILSFNVSPLIPFILCQIFFVHEFFRFPYLLREKTSPVYVLPYQFLKGWLEVWEPKSPHGFSCAFPNLALRLRWLCLG